MLRPGLGVNKTTMLHGQKAFPSLFRPICLRVQLSSPHMTRRSAGVTCKSLICNLFTLTQSSLQTTCGNSAHRVLRRRSGCDRFRAEQATTIIAGGPESRSGTGPQARQPACQRRRPHATTVSRHQQTGKYLGYLGNFTSLRLLRMT